MIRLPPTSIDISPNDLSFHLQQLDIYQGLLKQGFKKNEIIKYFETQNAKLASGGTTSCETSDPIPSTVELSAKSTDTPELKSWQSTVTRSPPDHLHANRSPSLSPESLISFKNGHTRATHDRALSAAGKGYVPRQSSLLQYSRGISSDTSSETDKQSVRIPFSPRANITYRPRSETYSYEESVIDENDLTHTVNTSLNDLQHLSLDSDLVPTSAASRRSNVGVVSELRPEAESFTPISLRQLHSYGFNDPKGKQKADSSPSSGSLSMPSSPPLSQSRKSPSLPKMPRTPLEPGITEPITARRRIHQHYLDGSFTIYDDSVPARLQPQTPADLGHGRMLDNGNAAFTAPPGMLRSPLPYQGRYVHGTRQPSGDQSPTTRALLIRERRQREFNRGARVEELRVNRTRTEQTDVRAEDMQITKDFWRDDLDADSVGEENFNESMLNDDVRRLRTISGNRRP